MKVLTLTLGVRDLKFQFIFLETRNGNSERFMKINMRICLIYRDAIAFLYKSG